MCYQSNQSIYISSKKVINKWLTFLCECDREVKAHFPLLFLERLANSMTPAKYK